jgi:hypothetical protein
MWRAHGRPRWEMAHTSNTDLPPKVLQILGTCRQNEPSKQTECQKDVVRNSRIIVNTTRIGSVDPNNPAGIETDTHVVP